MVFARPYVRRLMTTSSLARCTLSDLEVGASARNADAWDALLRANRTLVAVDVEPGDLARAGGVQRALAAAGRRGRKLPDLLIAAAAERRGLTILHYDHDFDLIADVTGQPHEWVVPRGSMD
ncbi:PIN domain-containing protein [Fodinicola feengrottensis]|uniref:PIN domain-containing protein n=1 Tax=Fodinicola feengrottensis TaxID=435914 RepID=UPI0028BD1BF0|nr:PIN domain-containing protein [Fodinicola feengrottensis]